VSVGEQCFVRVVLMGVGECDYVFGVGCGF